MRTPNGRTRPSFGGAANRTTRPRDALAIERVPTHVRAAALLLKLIQHVRRNMLELLIVILLVIILVLLIVRLLGVG